MSEIGEKILAGIKDVELDPTEVDLLFSMENPLEMTEAQRAVTVEALRRSRAEYTVKKKAKRAKKPKLTPVEIEGMSLDDLKIDMSDI